MGSEASSMILKEGMGTLMRGAAVAMVRVEVDRGCLEELDAAIMAADDELLLAGGWSPTMVPAITRALQQVSPR